jgi:hypothetical protein
VKVNNKTQNCFDSKSLLVRPFPEPLPAGLSKSVNRGNEKPLLDATDRERLRGTFALDELLLDELGCRAATAPPAATPHAATPTAATVAPRLAA